MPFSTPKKGKWILILLVCLILFETILFFFNKDSFNEKSLEYRIIEILLILLITTLYLYFHSPKYFYFDGKTIEFYNYKEKNQKIETKL